jgi:hypothetical protein
MNRYQINHLSETYEQSDNQKSQYEGLAVSSGIYVLELLQSQNFVSCLQACNK